MELFIDIETYSETDLQTSGVYRYAEDDSFEILCLSYSFDGGEVNTISLATGEELPIEVVEAIRNPKIKKFAYNATFERVCLSKYLGLEKGTYLDPESWFCDMVHAAQLSLPLSLDKVGTVLSVEKHKLDTGKDLIRYFCKPCEPTKLNGGRTRNLPIHDMYKWNDFLSYNKRDVETEIEIHNRLNKIPVLQSEWDLYHMDQRINDAGVHLDMQLVNKAIEADEINSSSNISKAKNITGIDNPNSTKQLKEWLIEQGMSGVDSLAKADVARLLKDATGNVEEILKLRQELAKSSVKKYIAMQNVVGVDDRARGLIQFCGATHTGRFSGRLIQVQNLVANHLDELELARNMLKEGDFDGISEKFGSLSNVLSELIRTAFIPSDDNKFIVCDYAQIEARVLAWYAKEKWRMKLFRDKKDLYCESASQMFGVKVEKNGENASLRKTGKVAELACGYGGSIGAMKAFGAVAMGIPEEKLLSIITAWRNSNPNIVKFWWDVDKMAKDVIVNKVTREGYGLRLFYDKGFMFIRLPSGRCLAYCKPKIGVNNFGGESITYEGVGPDKKWTRLETYGPKLVENIVQATARDLLCNAMKQLTDMGLKIVMHVHDEVIIDCGKDEMNLETVRSVMSKSPSWCKDLLLDAAGYECSYYYKD